MRKPGRLLPFVVLAACQPSTTDDVEHQLSRSFRTFQLVSLDPADTKATIDAQGSIELPLRDGALKLLLESRDLRADRYETTTSGGEMIEAVIDVAMYRGTIDTNPDTQARLTIHPDAVEGYFARPDQRFFLEPARRYATGAAEDLIVIYAADDALLGAEDHATCDHVSHQVARVTEGGPVAVATPGMRILEIATDADYELVQALGGAAQANGQILSILNMVEGEYESQLSITFEVVSQHAWTTPDPFSGTDMQSALASFQGYWNAQITMGTVPQRDVTQLYSGHPMAENRGYAYIDTICSAPMSAYAVNGWSPWEHARFLISAHELGHNFSAQHVDVGQNCGNTVMNAQLSVTTPLTFCEASRATIGIKRDSSPPTCLGVVTSPTPAVRAKVNDFDGDGDADLAVFRPSNTTWYTQTATYFDALQWGIATDRLVAADYDGDGKYDRAIYRDGQWWRFLSSVNNFDVVTFGIAGDIPVPADYDGDRKADVAIYRPSTGHWWVLESSTGAHYAVSWGIAEDRPVPGDVNGDGKADFVIYRPSNGQWWRLIGGTGEISALTWGIAEDVPMSIDINGDGKVDSVVFRPSDSGWYVLFEGSAQIYLQQFGMAGDIPVPGDYDGNGTTDIAVFRPSTHEWYLSLPDGMHVISFGASEDLPIRHIPALPPGA